MTFRGALGAGHKSESCQPIDNFCRTFLGCTDFDALIACAELTCTPSQIFGQDTDF